MFLHVIEAKYISDYTVWVRFNDGTAGNVDLSGSLDGIIFEPLRNCEYFKSFRLEGNTLTWENGANFAPEFLYELLKTNFEVVDSVSSTI